MAMTATHLEGPDDLDETGFGHCGNDNMSFFDNTQRRSQCHERPVRGLMHSWTGL